MQQASERCKIFKKSIYTTGCDKQRKALAVARKSLYIVEPNSLNSGEAMLRRAFPLLLVCLALLITAYDASATARQPGTTGKSVLSTKAAKSQPAGVSQKAAASTPCMGGGRIPLRLGCYEGLIQHQRAYGVFPAYFRVVVRSVRRYCNCQYVCLEIRQHAARKCDALMFIIFGG